MTAPRNPPDLELLSASGQFIGAQVGDDGTIYIQVNNSDVQIYDRSHALELARWLAESLGSRNAP